MNENLHLDDSGYELVIGWEGKRNRSYLGSVRIPTIGIGFVRYTSGTYAGHKVCMGDMMTGKEVKTESLNQIRSCENDVKKIVRVPLTQLQFNTCASLYYNISVTAFAKSTVIRCLNEREYKAICDAFAMWNEAGGRVISDLANRQSSEQKEFFRDGQRLTETLGAISDNGIVGRYFCCAAS